MFESVVLINESGKFKIQVLPAQAQFSTVQGIVTGDFNGDGKQDMLVAGNFFHTEVETTRADGGTGCVLLNRGDAWQALSVRESGLFLPYDVRDIRWVSGSSANHLLVSSNNDLLRMLSMKK